MKNNILTLCLSLIYFLSFNSCSLNAQNKSVFKVDNEYEIGYDSKWKFQGNPTIFSVKLNNTSKEVSFVILLKTVYPLGCENAKLTCIDYSNQYHSEVKSISINNWVGYETDDFNEMKEGDLVNKRILIKSGDKGVYEIHISGRKGHVLESQDEILNLLNALKLFPSDKTVKTKELVVNSDSLKIISYYQEINQQIIDELSRCNSIKIDKRTISSLTDFFEWQKNNGASNVPLKNANRVLQFFDFSNFEALEIDEKDKKITITFYTEDKALCSLSFDVLDKVDLPLNKRIILNKFFLDKSGKIYIDKKNNKIINSQPILFINSNAYPLKIERKSIMIK